MIETNPEALAIADALDAERKAKGPRGPLHGIPVLLKDNVDTADRMTTTAGSLALEGSTPPQRRRASRGGCATPGAVILGKTNLSEWANFRSTRSVSGWSGRGGQCRNPYALDRNPCGSSSGSGVAVVGEPHGARRRHRDRRLDRLPRHDLRRRRDQADRRPREPRRHHPDLARPRTPPGRWRAAWPTRRRC